MKRFNFAIVCFLALLLIGGGDAFAKGFRSSGGFRSSSFKSSKSSFSSKPKSYSSSKPKSYSSSKPKSYSGSKPKQSTTKTQSKQYSSSGVKANTFKSTKGTPKAFARTAPKAQSKSSLAAYKAQKSKYTKQPAKKTNYSSVSSRSYVRNAKVDRDFTYDRYYTNRDTYYTGRNWHAPAYSYTSYSSFGAWDAMFMWMMLDSMNDRSHFAHNHANDPGYQQWRNEANRLAEDNAELKAKLVALDGEVAQMKGQPVDPNYMPNNIPAEVALSADVLAGKAALAHQTDETSKAKQAEANLQEESEDSTFGWILVLVCLLGGVATYFLVIRRP